MLYNKYLAKALERQQMRQSRSFYSALAELNLSLSLLHQQIKEKIDVSNYVLASDYVNQFISYTTIWNLKFVYNFENPEVALLQILHLDYIFEFELSDSLQKEREQFAELKKQFDLFSTYKEEQIDARRMKLHDFINENQ